MALLAVAMSSFAAWAADHDPDGSSALPRVLSGDRGGWRARLFVSAPAERRFSANDGALPAPLTVNAQVARRLTRTTRFSVEVVNLLGKEPAALEVLAAPVVPTAPPEPLSRGIRLNFRTTF